jgi:hypothetical protein
MKKLLLLLMIVPMIGFGQCISGDCENGYSAYTWPSGDKYIGEYKDGKMHGQGTYTYANGDKYVGEFKDDLYDGIGKLTYSDGRVEEGRFMIGVYIGKE